MGRAERITEMLKLHDSMLYCERNKEGKLCVYRKGTRWEHYQIGDIEYAFARPAPHFIFAITDNWKTTGVPVEWGLLPILNRIKAIDLWNRDLAEEVIQQTEKQNESAQRDLANSTESFLKDFRRQFARATNDINTSNLDKKRDLRRIRNGYR